MANELTPILQAAYDILKKAGRKGMHVSEIAQAAVAQHKNLGHSPKEFQKKVSAALSNNLKLKSNTPTFSKVNWEKKDGKSKQGKPRQGWYRLRQEKTVPARTVVQAPKVGTSQMGCAGEHAVMSELLFWGYNPSIMAVDDGVDIVASKDGKFFYIQVKTASCQDGNKYQFSILQNSFKKYDTYNVFYVFVMRNNQGNDFVILPVGSIHHYLNSGVIKSSDKMSLSISHDDKRSKYTLNGRSDITAFFGNFGQIK